MTQKTYEEDVVFTTGPAKLGARGQGGQCPYCKLIPVMRTGLSLCSISNREKPVFITGIPANKNRIFPVWKYYTGKTLFWPCTGPVRDCSVPIYANCIVFTLTCL